MLVPESIAYIMDRCRYDCTSYDDTCDELCDGRVHIYCETSKREKIAKLINDNYYKKFKTAYFNVLFEIFSDICDYPEDPQILEDLELEKPPEEYDGGLEAFFRDFGDDLFMDYDVEYYPLSEIFSVSIVDDGILVKFEKGSLSIFANDIDDLGACYGDPCESFKDLLKDYQDVYFEVYIYFVLHFSSCTDLTQYEYSSKTDSYEETDKVYDYVGKIIAESMMCSDFWDELQGELGRDELEFFKAYSKWIPEEAYDHLLEIANNSDSQNLIPEILECKNKHFPKTGDTDLTKELALD